MIRELRGDGVSQQSPQGTAADRTEGDDADRPAGQRGVRRPYREYATITAIYLALYGVFAAFAGRRDTLARRIAPLDLALLGLATVRLSRLAAWEGVTSFMRLPIVEHGPNDPVTGPEQKPRGEGWVRAIGELILCTTCVGTWIAAVLTYGLYLAPSVTRPFLAIMATAGLSQAADATLATIYAARNRLEDRKE